MWQIGDIGCDPGYVVKDHEQCCYEITCVVGGRGSISRNDKFYDIHKGQLFLNRCGEIHCIKSDVMEPIRYFYLGFDFDKKLTQGIWKDIKDAFDECENPLANDISDVHNIFSSVFNEMMTNDTASQKMIEYSVYQILLLSYRALMLKNPRRYISGEPMEQSRQLIYSIIVYIDTNICAIEHLNDVSKQVGYSYTYISRLFTKVVGKSLRNYYNEKRFEKAVGFLASGMKSTQVATLLNYKSLHSFSKAFSNYYGMSPTQYKEKVLNKNKDNC
ncbi:MAG: AraC family transcriptional regulator [Oscillospiraceae bacterium]|nr:AraC family transcriptional regulator [Oscillospiraceae bacterium]MDD4545685.1 AraC family transcriptional regulator [Oscillospiraceae bacterium]